MRERQPEHPHTDIPIPLKTWQQLLDGSFKSAFAKEDWEIATEAIDEWVRRHNPDAITLPAASGYQWKSLFLPNGTLLRAVFGGKNYHCTVEADQILYNGKPVSPSGFVNAVGGIRRNAWRCTWLLFPDSKEWKLADALRTRERPRRARKPAGEVLQASAPSMARTPVGEHDVQVPRTSARGEQRERRQRINEGDRMTTMLRQELLPLLYRMCARDAMAAAPSSLRA